MRVGPYLEKLDQALWLTRILQLTVLLLAVLALLLARQSTILHVAPPDFQREYTVRNTSASRDYIEQMSIFLLVNGLTVNPDSAIYSTKSFLRWLTPEARGKLETRPARRCRVDQVQPGVAGLLPAGVRLLWPPQAPRHRHPAPVDGRPTDHLPRRGHRPPGRD